MLISAIMLPNLDLLYYPGIDAALLDEAIGVLRISGRIIQKLADQPDCVRVDSGAALIAGQLVASAWVTGQIGDSEAMH